MGRRCALVLSLLAAFGLFATGNYARAADPVFCGKYANDADQAVKHAKQLKCGFQGPRWIKGTSGHLAWCLIADEALAQTEADARAADLKDCTCHWYADQTMVQIATNIANKCGFTGLRWLDDKQAHYDWCFKMDPGLNAMEGEIKIRKNMLNGC